jgi:hypothetical protein
MDFSVYHRRADRGALAAHLYVVIHRATSTATETGLNDKFKLVKLLHRFAFQRARSINRRTVSVNHDSSSNKKNG